MVGRYSASTATTLTTTTNQPANKPANQLANQPTSHVLSSQYLGQVYIKHISEQVLINTFGKQIENTFVSKICGNHSGFNEEQTRAL